LAHHQFFWNIGHSPIEAPLWTAIWDKSGAIGNFLGEQIENSRNIIGTHMEHDENKGKKKKNPPSPKRKKTGSLMCPC
jgi:hypothetical protein